MKQRLENLKRLFEEDEENEHVRMIQEQWERQDHATRSHQEDFKPKSLFRQSLKKRYEEAPPAEEQRLHSFLLSKIKHAQKRSDPHQLVALEAEKEALQQKEEAALKYQASALTHIAEFKHLGQEHIENQYIDRLFRGQTDYHFEKYEHAQIKQQSKQAAATKYMQTQNLRTSLVRTNMFEQQALEGAQAEGQGVVDPTLQSKTGFDGL